MKDTQSKPPPLTPGMTITEFRAWYRTKAELVDYARLLGLPADGQKPLLSARIERKLQGLPDEPALTPKRPKGPCDSDQPLQLDTPVVNYKNDDKTRAFFTVQIGPHFHFSYHLNQYRLAHKNLTYGDLVKEWVAEYERRKAPDYKAPIASHGEYNRYIRDFFADKQNEGKPFREAVESWNAIKNSRGDRRYRREGSKKE